MTTLIIKGHPEVRKDMIIDIILKNLTTFSDECGTPQNFSYDFGVNFLTIRTTPTFAIRLFQELKKDTRIIDLGLYE